MPFSIGEDVLRTSHKSETFRLLKDQRVVSTRLSLTQHGNPDDQDDLESERLVPSGPFSTKSHEPRLHSDTKMELWGRGSGIDGLPVHRHNSLSPGLLYTSNALTPFSRVADED